MKGDYEKLYHALEKDHFWFRSRRDIIVQLLGNYSRNVKILDIGCSSGTLIHELIDQGFDMHNIHGIDISENAVSNCKSSGIKNVYQMDAQEVELPIKFDVLIASDCLEHLKKDTKALKKWFDLLNDNGTLIVFVPAYMFLWSHHDEENMHFRRYNKKELKEKLLVEGYHVKKASYWNFLLFFPIFIFRQISKIFRFRKRTSGNLQINSWLNVIFYKLISIENNWLKKFNFPFGVSCFCIARKNGEPNN